MTDPTRLPSAAELRLAALRRRRAELAATRAAFEECRRHGLKARHAAKLAYLASRRAGSDEQVEKPSKEERTSSKTENRNAA